MSAFASRVLAAGRPMASASYVWVPLMGAGWVLVNALLIAAATQVSFPFPFIFSALAGVINGAILSIVAVAKVSARFQSGATGLLGGMTLSGLRSDGSIISHTIAALHHFVDKALDGFQVPGGEALHDQIVQITVDIAWTTILVLLASLIIKWVQDARGQAGQRVMPSGQAAG